jgi:Txe/YoeB family toxin of toxin-antitoxin system
MWRIKYEKRAQKDLDKLKYANLLKSAQRLIEIIRGNPFEPKFEKLSGDLDGLFSRRINLKHRLLYKAIKKTSWLLLSRCGATMTIDFVSESCWKRSDVEKYMQEQSGKNGK